MILAVDPGKTVGWARWTNEGAFVGKYEGSVEYFYTILTLLVDRDVEPNTFVVENYRLDPNIPQGGSLMEASQVIGAVSFVSNYLDASLVLQPNSILPMAQKWTGVTVPRHGIKNHDANSAYNHGMYFMIKQGIIKNPAHSRIERISGS